MSPFVLVILFAGSFAATAVSIDMPSEEVCRRELRAISAKQNTSAWSGPVYAMQCIDRREATVHG